MPQTPSTIRLSDESVESLLAAARKDVRRASGASRQANKSLARLEEKLRELRIGITYAERNAE